MYAEEREVTRPTVHIAGAIHVHVAVSDRSVTGTRGVEVLDRSGTRADGQRPAQTVWGTVMHGKVDGRREVVVLAHRFLLHPRPGVPRHISFLDVGEEGKSMDAEERICSR